MIPGVALGIAWYSAGHPMLLLIIPCIPFVAAGDAALMTPNIRLAADELVDIELHRLRDAGISHPEVNVIGEVMQVRNDGLVGVFQSLRGHAANQMHVPERIGPLDRSTAVNGFCGLPIH